MYVSIYVYVYVYAYLYNTCMCAWTPKKSMKVSYHLFYCIRYIDAIWYVDKPDIAASNEDERECLHITLRMLKEKKKGSPS